MGQHTFISSNKNIQNALIKIKITKKRIEQKSNDVKIFISYKIAKTFSNCNIVINDMF